MDQSQNPEPIQEPELPINLQIAYPTTAEEIRALAWFIQATPEQRLGIIRDAARLADLLAGRVKPWELMK